MSDLNAIAQTAINGVGLGGLGLTVYYARRTWNEARRSADIAQAALARAQSDSEAQDRLRTEQLHLMAQQAGAMGQIAHNTYRA